MKKTTATLLLAAISYGCLAQSNNMLVRHDTMLLKASECEWIVKSLIKNDPSFTSEIGKSVPQVILEEIQKGKLEAVDVISDKPVPAKEIFTWQMPKDSMMTADAAGGFTKLVIVQRERSGNDFKQIRVYQDWYIDFSTGKIQSQIKWIELLEEVHSSSGYFTGHRPFCRIYY